MATIKNVTSITTSIIDDLGATPVDGDTVLLVQGSQTYRDDLDAIASADLAVFTQMPSSGASLGNGNLGLQIDAALVEIFGTGAAYSITGGENASQDRVVFAPTNSQASGLFYGAACTNFEAMAARQLSVMSDYDITNGYITGLVGSFFLEAGSVDPTILVLAPGSGSRLNAILERSPTTLSVYTGARALMDKIGEFPTNLVLGGGEYVHRSGTITAITGGGIIDLTQITEDWAPTAWDVTLPTIVKAPPAKGFAWAQPNNVRAPFIVVPYGQG